MGDRSSSSGHRVGNVVQFEIEEDRPGVLRFGDPPVAGHAVGQEELQPELDAADGRLRPSGDALDEAGGVGEIDGVDAAIDRVRRGAHGGRNLEAALLSSNREFAGDQELRTRRTAACQPA